MYDRAYLKEQAKKSLTGNWLMGAIICFIVTAVSGLISAIPGYGVFIGLVVLGPLNFGVSYTFLSFSRNNGKLEIESLFKGFNSDFFSKAFFLNLLKNVYIFLWALLFIIPGIVKAYSYYMSNYILADHPDYTPKECIEKSREMMEGHKLELFVQHLSFLGWAILCIFTLGVGGFFLSAYIYTTEANFYNNIMGEPLPNINYNDSNNNINNNNNSSYNSNSNYYNTDSANKTDENKSIDKDDVFKL